MRCKVMFDDNKYCYCLLLCYCELQNKTVDLFVPSNVTIYKETRFPSRLGFWLLSKNILFENSTASVLLWVGRGGRITTVLLRSPSRRNFLPKKSRTSLQMADRGQHIILKLVNRTDFSS